MENLKIFPDVNSLSHSAADYFIQYAAESIQVRGLFTVALSGGSTPLSMYRVLASESFRGKVDWSRVLFFWGDERCVPPDHHDSNYHRAWETILSTVPVPETNIHRIMTEYEPIQAAAEYEEMLVTFFSRLPDETQRISASFDLVLLGMGDDGHTASLFPGTPVISEKTRWVRPVYVDQIGAWRITLTAPLITRASHIIFLVAGKNKSWTIPRVLYGPYQPDRFPAQLIMNAPSNPLWLVDEAAASLI